MCNRIFAIYAKRNGDYSFSMSGMAIEEMNLLSTFLYENEFLIPHFEQFVKIDKELIEEENEEQK